MLIVSRTYKRLSRLGITGFVIWTLCVAVAHLYVIAAASASVRPCDAKTSLEFGRDFRIANHGRDASISMMPC
jgi:hypothetical protein